jgi:hypothetical protein
MVVGVTGWVTMKPLGYLAHRPRQFRAFPVVSFRHLESPNHIAKQGYRNYFALVEVNALPDLKGWRKINVRDPKLTGSVPAAIRKSVGDNPDLFAFMNCGIVLSVHSAHLDNKTNQLTLK